MSFFRFTFNRLRMRNTYLSHTPASICWICHDTRRKKGFGISYVKQLSKIKAFHLYEENLVVCLPLYKKNTSNTKLPKYHNIFCCYYYVIFIISFACYIRENITNNTYFLQILTKLFIFDAVYFFFKFTVMGVNFFNAAMKLFF